jgi:hypothetical protein
MKTVAEWRADYETLTGLASDVSRKLGFAGIAVIWIFKTDVKAGIYAVPAALYLAGVAIVASLTFDLLQYAWGSIVWGIFWRTREKKGLPADHKFSANPKLNWPALGFFWLKLLAMVIAYYFLLRFLVTHITPS